jgi:aminoglycoside phosphotransferase (APT) family kinase protein
MGGRKAVLHGDFHANNVLGGSQGCTVIDWSDAWCGDPRYDVAWVRLLVRADEEPDGGRADLERYGLPLGDLGPFEAFGAAKILAERFAVKGGRSSPHDREFETYLRRVLADRLGVDQAKLAG